MSYNYGNKNALGNKGGRPPLNREELAIDLVEWSQKRSSRNIYAWLGEKYMSYETLNRWAREDNEFYEAYTIAKQNIALNREESVGQYGGLDRSVFLANHRVYDRMAHDQWKEDKAYEYGLKEKSEQTAAVNVNIDSKPYKRDKPTVQVSVQAVPDSDVASAE